MFLALFFILILVALIAWHVAIAWYLKRYILQDDRLHHTMYGVFWIGNAVFIAAVLLLFIRIPWNAVSATIFADLADKAKEFFP